MAQAAPQGCKILVAGDPKSFFTLYPLVRAAGLRPAHLDRGGELLAGGAAADVADAVAQACAAADCVLAADALVAHPERGFPLHCFQHVVVYVSEEPSQRAVLEALEGAACGVTTLRVSWPGDGGGEAAPPAEAPRPAPPAQPAAPAAAAPPAPPAAQRPAPDWPLVVSSDARRPVRRRRPLLEALLELEREGAAVAERPLALLDLVLSPSAALMIFPNEAHMVRAQKRIEPRAAALAVPRALPLQQGGCLRRWPLGHALRALHRS